jgi:hypothetical protein
MPPKPANRVKSTTTDMCPVATCIADQRTVSIDSVDKKINALHQRQGSSLSSPGRRITLQTAREKRVWTKSKK